MDIRNVTDKELMVIKQVAIETQDGRLLKQVKAEMNRRNREQ